MSLSIGDDIALQILRNPDNLKKSMIAHISDKVCRQIVGPSDMIH